MTTKQQPDMMRFERARIIGARALQIAMGAPIILTDVPDGLHDPVEIAEREFAAGVVPITVSRPDRHRPGTVS